MWLYATITIWGSYSRVYYELNVVKNVVKSFPLVAPGFPKTQKTLENQWFSSLLVEISGIEPLTS